MGLTRGSLTVSPRLVSAPPSPHRPALRVS